MILQLEKNNHPSDMYYEKVPSQLCCSTLSLFPTGDGCCSYLRQESTIWGLRTTIHGRSLIGPWQRKEGEIRTHIRHLQRRFLTDGTPEESRMYPSLHQVEVFKAILSRECLQAPMQHGKYTRKFEIRGL